MQPMQPLGGGGGGGGGGYGDQEHILPTDQLAPYNHVTKCLKYSITVFAFFLWVVGGLFAAIGGYINTQVTSQLIPYSLILHVFVRNYSIESTIKCHLTTLLWKRNW